MTLVPFLIAPFTWKSEEFVRPCFLFFSRVKLHFFFWPSSYSLQPAGMSPISCALVGTVISTASNSLSRRRGHFDRLQPSSGGRLLWLIFHCCSTKMGKHHVLRFWVDEKFLSQQSMWNRNINRFLYTKLINSTLKVWQTCALRRR